MPCALRLPTSTSTSHGPSTPMCSTTSSISHWETHHCHSIQIPVIPIVTAEPMPDASVLKHSLAIHPEVVEAERECDIIQCL
jgi:hypothetical protein